MTIRDIAIAFGYEVDEQSEKKANESIDKLKSVATKALGAIGIGFSLVNANEIITEFGKINAQIQNATKDLSDQRAIQDQIIAAANEARASYADIANITSKLVQQNSDLFDVAGAARYAELTTKLFKSENKEQGDILALQDAINVSFAKGAVEAETIGQIIEQSPAAADLLARHIGAARSELEQMASDGKISLEQLRDAFLNNADEIEAAFGNVDLTISDALLNIRNQWGLWLAQMDKTLGVTKTIAKVMTRTFTQFMNVLRKVQTYTERFVKKVGGAENALKLLAMAAGAIFIALNAGKILDFLKNAKSLLTGINLKTVALVAAILLIALAIDDFINFMQGNDSVIGVIFEKWGIDADEVRKRIIEAWEGIKAFLLRTWAAIKDIFKGVLQFLTGVFTGDWEKAFGGLKSIAGSAVSYIENVFGKFAPIVKAVAVAFASWKAIKTAFGFVKGAATAISKLNAVTKKASVVTKGLGTAFKFLTSPAGLAVIAIAALAAVIIMLIKNGGDVDALVQQFSDGLNKFTGIIEKVVAGIAEKAPQIVEAIVNAITKVLNVIVEKLPMFIDMGIKLITSLINGIVKMLPVVVSTVVKLAAAILTAIVNLLPKLIDAGVKLITSLIDGIVSMLPSIIEAVVKLITALVDALAGLLPKLIEAGVLLITSLIEGIVSALPQIIAALVGLIPVLIKAITDSLPKLIKAGIQIILSLVKGIVGAIPQIIKAVVGLVPVIVKALLDALPQLIQAGIQIIIALAQGLIQAIPELLKAIPQIIGAVLDGFKELFPGLAPIFDGVKKHFEIVFNAIAKTFKTVIGIFETVFGAFKSLFSGDWEGLWNGIKKLFSQIWDLIKGIFKAAFDVFKNILSTFGNIFKGIWNGLADFFTGIWDGIKNFFKGIWDAIVQTVQKNIAVCKALFKAIGDFFKAIWDAIVAFFTGIWDAITATVTNAGETIKGLFAAVGDFFTGIWNGIAGFFKSVWDGLLVVVNAFVAVFKAAFTAVSDFFKGIWNGLADFFTGIWDGIKSVFSTVADFFTGIFTKAAEGIKSAFSGIKDFFSSVFQAVANAVKAPINWIIGGINNFIGGLNKIKIPDWVPGVGGKGFSLPTIPQLARGGVLEKGQTGYLEGNGAEAVVPLEKNTEWIKKVAGLFRQQMSENGAAGTDNEINGIVEAVKGVGGVVGSAIKTVAEKAAGAKANADSNGFTDALRSFGANLTSLVKGATASPGTVQSMVTSTTNRSVTQNNYFENTFNGDRAGQQRSSEAMGKNTADATGQLARALAFAR